MLSLTRPARRTRYSPCLSGERRSHLQLLLDDSHALSIRRFVLRVRVDRHVLSYAALRPSRRTGAAAGVGVPHFAVRGLHGLPAISSTAHSGRRSQLAWPVVRHTARAVGRRRTCSSSATSATRTSNLAVGVPIFGGGQRRHDSMLMYDAGLEYDFGSSKAGTRAVHAVRAGRRRRDAVQHRRGGDPDRRRRQTSLATSALAPTFRSGSGVALRLLAKDYIGKFNFQDATGFDVDGITTHNFALTAGLRLDF